MGANRIPKSPDQMPPHEPLSLRGGFRSAYNSDRGPRLVQEPRRKTATNVRNQREVSRLNRAFSRFFRYAGVDRLNKRHDTYYDLHRNLVYNDQSCRLYYDYPHMDLDFLASSTTVLDVGCGTGKLIRRIVRTPSMMQDLESGARKMRILGIDVNPDALRAAAAKRDILFDHHPRLEGNLEMELLLLDVMDLDRLNLAKTCIGEERVDFQLASDIFRWLREPERPDLLHALRRKLKKTGYLMSFELTDPYLPTWEHLPQNLASCFQTFSNLYPMRLGELYEMAEEAGFVRVPKSKLNKYDDEGSRFPPMVSIIFSPGDGTKPPSSR